MNVATLSNQRLFAQKRRQLVFFKKTQTPRKKFITADIECCVVDVTTNSNKYVIAEHTSISRGYKWRSNGEEVPFNDNSESYFGLDCLKRFATEFLEIETKYKIKYNKKIVFYEGDKL